MCVCTLSFADERGRYGSIPSRHAASLAKQDEPVGTEDAGMVEEGVVLKHQPPGPQETSHQSWAGKFGTSCNSTWRVVGSCRRSSRLCIVCLSRCQRRIIEWRGSHDGMDGRGR